MEQVIFNGLMYALIMRSDYHNDGVNFLTNGDELLEFAYMSHPSGHKVVPHYHLPIKREIFGTQEIVYIKAGIVEFTFYDDNNKSVGSRLLRSGEWILLLKGGHGINVVEDSVIIEIKNGPYAGLNDKVKF